MASIKGSGGEKKCEKTEIDYKTGEVKDNKKEENDDK